MGIKNVTTSVTALPLGKAATQEEQRASIAQLTTELEATKQKLANTADYSEYLSLEDQATLEETKAAVEAELTMLAALEKLHTDGVWDPTGELSPLSEETLDPMFDGKPTGWYDSHGTLAVGQNDADAAAAGDTYAGTIILPNSGVYDATNTLASNAKFFVAGDDVTAVYGKQVGSDVHYQVYYTDGSVQTFVGKLDVVRAEPIYITAQNATHPVTIDMSHVLRISDGNWGKAFGEVGGYHLIGSAHDDRLVGSQGSDDLVGGQGHDQLFGMAGIDNLFGDELGGDPIGPGGDDFLSGGAGADILQAGGGIDTVTNTDGDAASQHENVGATEQYDVAPAGSFNAPGATPTVTNGVLTIDASQVTGGTIAITMPDGYSVGAVEPDSNDMGLLVTFEGFDAQGQPHTVRYKILNYFDPAYATIVNIHGNGADNIIDASKVTLQGNNQLNLFGHGGDDVLVAAKSTLDGSGLSQGNLGKTTVGVDGLKAILDSVKIVKPNGATDLKWGIPAGAPLFWWNYDLEEMGNNLDGYLHDNEIVLTFDGYDSYDISNGLDFALPEGYDDAVLLNQPNGDRLIVLLKHNVDGTAEQAVVRLKGVPANTPILVGHKAIAGIGATSQIVGGDGTNTIVASANGATTNAENVVAGTYPFAYAANIDTDMPDGEDLQQVLDELAQLEQTLADTQQKWATEKDKAKKDEYFDEITELATAIAALEAKRDDLLTALGMK